MPSPYPQNEEVVTEEGRGLYKRDEIVALRVFANNDTLLKLLRKVFFQMELNEEELAILGNAFNGNQLLYKAFKKVCLPEISYDAPIGANPSRWVDRKYSDMLMAETHALVVARQLSIKFIKLGLGRLLDIVENKVPDAREMVIDLNMSDTYEDKTPMETKVAICAWQDSLSHLEHSCLLQAKLLAEMPDESPEQRAARLKKDSAR